MKVITDSRNVGFVMSVVDAEVLAKESELRQGTITSYRIMQLIGDSGLFVFFFISEDH